MQTDASDHAAQRDAFVARLFNATLGAMDLFSIYLGDRLNLYRVLEAAGPLNSRGLAWLAGIDERYARQWLEQQAVTGILEVTEEARGVDDDPSPRRFRLPAGHAEVLADPESLSAMVPLARLLAACVRPLSALLTAYRTGGGVPFAEYGEDLREGQAGQNRPQFANLLATEWLPAMPDVHARLQADPPARVADIGMGAGWSSIAFGRAYPRVRVDGFDLDAPSVELARANAADAGVADRVTFHVRDAGDPSLAGRYDLACAFECVHDMSDPVSALATMGRLVGEGGTVFIMDERVADEFMAPGDDIERFMYGFSILHCLPVGLAEQPSVGTGTVMRSATLRRYAEAAGFRAVEVLPIAHDWFRFYRLTA